MKHKRSRAGEYARNTKAMKCQPGGIGGEQSRATVEAAVRFALSQANPMLDLSEVTISMELDGEGRVGVSGVDEQTLTRAYELYRQQP